jgi:hypothetical protein
VEPELNSLLKSENSPNLFNIEVMKIRLTCQRRKIEIAHSSLRNPLQRVKHFSSVINPSSSTDRFLSIHVLAKALRFLDQVNAVDEENVLFPA